MLLQELETLLRIAGGQNTELFLERADEVFERFLFVIDIEDGKLFVIVKIVHAVSPLMNLIPSPEIPA
jgi:hypothetical protein